MTNDAATTAPDYSKAALERFLNTAGDQGLLNSNTVSGWKYAVARILEDYAMGDDMRAVDPGTAVKRYHHKHPGVMKGTSLKEYERRLTRALADFKVFVDDPTKYAGRGRGPTEATGNGAKAKTKKSGKPIKVEGPIEVMNVPTFNRLAELAATGVVPSAIVGLRLEFPMRSDFLATVMVPRDMKIHEARRFADFIMTLAENYVPKQVD
jgi:hypothetical protein